MGSKIFREKSIERISSPEQLDVYLKVPNISLWLILLVLFTVAASFLVWSFAGDIVTKVDTTGVFTRSMSDTLKVSAAVPVEDAESLKLGMQCKVYDRYSQEGSCLLGHVSGISKEISKFEEENYPEGWVNQKVIDSKECKEVFLDLEMDDTKKGKYKWNEGKEPANSNFLRSGELCKVEIIKESIKPINFLFSD